MTTDDFGHIVTRHASLGFLSGMVPMIYNDSDGKEEAWDAAIREMATQGWIYFRNSSNEIMPVPLLAGQTFAYLTPAAVDRWGDEMYALISAKMRANGHEPYAREDYLDTVRAHAAEGDAFLLRMKRTKDEASC